jgi:hypothetical protein
MYSPPSFTSFRSSPSMLCKEGEISDIHGNTFIFLCEIEKSLSRIALAEREGWGDEYM